MSHPCVFAGMYMRLNYPRIMASENVPGHPPPLACVCVCAQAMVLVYRSEVNFQVLVLFFHARFQGSNLGHRLAQEVPLTS